MSFRIIGFDGPEIFRPSCEAEKIHGMAGKRRLEQIIRESDDVVAFIPASKKDKIKDILSIGGRPAAHVFADGVNIAITLRDDYTKWEDYSMLTKKEAVELWGNYES